MIELVLVYTARQRVMSWQAQSPAKNLVNDEVLQVVTKVIHESIHWMTILQHDFIVVNDMLRRLEKCMISSSAKVVSGHASQRTNTTLRTDREVSSE